MSNIVNFEDYKKENIVKCDNYELRDKIISELKFIDSGFGLILNKEDAEYILDDDAMPEDLKFLIDADNVDMASIARPANGVYFLDLREVENE